MRATFGTLALVVVLAGCGADSSAELEALQERIDELEAEQTTLTTTSTTTTVPTDPYEEAAEYYLEIVTPLNCTDVLMEMAKDSTGVWDDDLFYPSEWTRFIGVMRPVFENDRDAYIRFVEGLAVYDWPDDIQPFIDDLAAQQTRIAANMDKLASAQTLVEFGDLLEVDLDWSRTADAVVESKLGLPSTFLDGVKWCEGLDF